jgi:transcriptional regulator with XRE-family HTH domain
MDLKDLKQEFSRKITDLRQQLHYTRAEMGNCFNVSLGTYRRYEEGKILPGFPCLRSIAARLGLSLDWLVYGRGPVYYKEKEEIAKTESSQKSLLEAAPAEITELLEHMHRIPLLRYEVLAYFYKFKAEHKELVSEAMTAKP